jgi:hypothetical protein
VRTIHIRNRSIFMKTIYVLEGVDIYYNPDDWSVIAVGLDKNRIEEIKQMYLKENPEGNATIRLFTDGAY